MPFPVSECLSLGRRTKLRIVGEYNDLLRERTTNYGPAHNGREGAGPRQIPHLLFGEGMTLSWQRFQVLAGTDLSLESRLTNHRQKPTKIGSTRPIASRYMLLFASELCLTGRVVDPCAPVQRQRACARRGLGGAITKEKANEGHEKKNNLPIVEIVAQQNEKSEK